MNILDPYFENFQINHSYACRKGKGTLKAIKIAQKYNSSSSFFLKMDIKKYFDSVDHNILKKLLHRRFKDPDIITILYTIIDSYSVTENKGIPIGNLTSQYFANFYLAYLDRYIKQELCIKKYVKYMDDFVIFSNSKDEIFKYIELIEEFISQKLKLVLKIKYINRVENGLPFLGFLIKPTYIGVLKKNRKASVKKYKKLNRLLKMSGISQLEYGVRVQSIISGKLKVIGIPKLKEIYPCYDLLDDI